MARRGLWFAVSQLSSSPVKRADASTLVALDRGGLGPIERLFVKQRGVERERLSDHKKAERAIRQSAARKQQPRPRQGDASGTDGEGTSRPRHVNTKQTTQHSIVYAEPLF